MSGLPMFLDLLAAAAVPGPRRWGRRGRPEPAPIHRARWWKQAAAVLLVAQQVPLVVGTIWLFVAAAQLGEDDFLFFVGLLLMFVAFIGGTVALGCLSWAVVAAARVLRDHGHARWYVAGFATAGTLASLDVLFMVGAFAHPLFVGYALSSGGLLALAVVAPTAATDGPFLPTTVV